MMIIIEAIAILACSIFFGTALYISLAQHPAAMKAGMPVAAEFFPPMYRHAAPFQVSLAVSGTLIGGLLWILNGDLRWALGAGLLFLVIPFTVLVMKPINDQLLNSEPKEEGAQRMLLDAWALKHWLRTVSSGGAVCCYLWAALS